MLLAPSAQCVPDSFRSVNVNPDQHGSLLAGLQRLRGSVYLDDGAIVPTQLSVDGRHIQEVDESSWHLVSVGDDGEVVGCARYHEHHAGVRPQDLGVWKSALAQDPTWQPWVEAAVNSEIATARRRHVAYVEVGGWAIAPDLRCSLQAVEIALSMYALAGSIGGCIGITTATVRNHSARILRKLGGRSLEADGCELPAYYDAQYRCEMEVLRFDSAALSQKYAGQVATITNTITRFPVLCAQPALWNVLPLRPAAPAAADRRRHAVAESVQAACA